MDEKQRPVGQRRRKMADHFTDKVAQRGRLKIKAMRHKDETVWFGVGMFGIVGWSIAIPTLIGVALGLWIDRSWPSRYSWALMLLIAGVIVGCINAAYWVRRVRSSIIKDDDDDEPIE